MPCSQQNSRQLLRHNTLDMTLGVKFPMQFTEFYGWNCSLSLSTFVVP